MTGGQGRTLRVRLTLLLTTLLLAGCAAVGVATTVAVHGFLTSRLDQQLALAGNRYAVSLEHNDHDADNSPETETVGQAVGTLGARLLDGQLTAVGVVPAEVGRPVVLTAAARQVITDAASGASLQSVDVPGLGSYRILVDAGRDGDVLVTGLPLHQVQETLQVVILTEVIVFIVVVLVIGVIGAIAVRRALRPLERVVATALRVSELPLATGDVNLHERVHVDEQRSEVGQVGSAINHMLGQIETALHVRQASEDRLRQFVADASHELRTPLAIVRSHAELIELELAEETDSVRDSLRSIDSGTRRMGRLVQDLLLLARLDSGLPLDHAEVDLTRVVLESVGDARTAGQGHHWVMELPTDLVIVTGDEDRLRQAVINLLANARRHTPPATTVTISLAVQGDTVELVVADDGPGIPEELLPTVTGRFVHGSAGRANGTGSGLGLSIVVGILTAHRGHLEVASKPGHTQLRMVLPVDGLPARKDLESEPDQAIASPARL